MPDGTSGSFTIQAKDVEGGTSSPITVYLSISPNHIPTANSVPDQTLNEDSSITITVSGQDQDSYHNLVLDVGLITAPSKGVVSIGDIVLSHGKWVTTNDVANLDTTGTSHNITYTPNQYWFGSDSLSFQFRDLLGAVSNTIQVSLTVSHVNHPPASQSYNLSTPLGVTLNFTITATDVDTMDTLVFLIGSDISVFTGKNGTLKLSSTNAQLTGAINVTSSVSRTLNLVYLPPLGIEVKNIPTFSFYVYDGTAVSGPYYIALTVGPPTNNHPPYSYPTNATVYQESSVNIVLDNYVGDPDSNPITVYISSVPSKGNVTLADGTVVASSDLPLQIPAATTGSIYKLSYYPNYMYWGSDQFTYYTMDSYNATSVPATCNITVIHINKPPKISVSNNLLTVNRKAVGTFDITISDVDSVNIVLSSSGSAPTPSTLNYTCGSLPWNKDNSAKTPYICTVQWTPGILVPDGSNQVISYLVNDTEGATAGPVSVNFSVTPNNPPTNLGGGPVTVTENSDTTFTVTGTDPDWYDSPALSIMVTVLPGNGKLTGIDGSDVSSTQWITSDKRSNSDTNSTQYQFKYKPSPYFFGNDTISVKFQDQLGAVSQVLTIDISVTFQDTPPSSASLNVTAYIRIPKQFTLTGPIDPDANDPSTINILPPTDWTGNLIFSSDNSFDINSLNNSIYQKTVNGPWNFFYTGNSLTSTSFSFYVTDSHGGQSPTYFVDINTIINPSDKPPVASNFNVTTFENEFIVFDFGPYIKDLNNEKITSVTIQSSPDPSLGTMHDFNTGNTFGTVAGDTLYPSSSTILVKYVPVTNAHGVTTFTYNAMDYGMSVSNIGTVTVNVIWVDASPTLTVNGGTSDVSVNVVRNSTAVFNVTIGDIDSNNVTLLMTQNTIPFGTGGSYSTAFISDPLGNPSTSFDSNTAVVLDHVPLPPRIRNYTISWTPSVSIPDGQTGKFSLQAQDPEGKTSVGITINLAVTANNPPVISSPSPDTTVTLNEDGSTTINFIGTDPDPWHNLKLDFCITSLPSHGSISLGGQTLTVGCVSVTTVPNTDSSDTLRSVTYTPTPIWYGSDSISYRFRDLLGATSPVQSISLNINHVNHPPTSKSLTLSTSLNKQLSFSLTGADVDGDPLTFHIASDISTFTGTHGTIKLTSGNSLSSAVNLSASLSGTLDMLYTPPYGLEVSDLPTFTFYVSDFPNDVVGPYTVQITVGPPTTHNPPVSQSFNTSLKQDTSVDIILDSYVSDPDGIAINISIQTLPTKGVLLLSGNKITSVPTQITANSGSPLYKLTYVPTQHWWGQDQFQYNAVDFYKIPSVNGVVGITVIHVNSPPNISVVPTNLTVGRTSSGTVKVSVVDIDSAFVVVTLTNVLPLPSVLSMNSVTPVPIPLWNVTNSQPGQVQSTILSWSPDILLGDGSTGSLLFLATDTEGATDGPRSVSLSVVPNNVPTNLGGGPVNITENNPGVDITVTGDDLDLYDKSVLSVMVTSFPTLGTFTLNSGGDVPKNSWISSNSRTNSDGQPTTYTFHYVPNLYVFGSDSFSIVFQDHLGAQSSVVAVQISITFQDTPPSSNNITINAYIQNTVTFTIPAYDPDSNDPTTLSILPPENWEGKLVFNQDGTFNISTLNTVYTKTGQTPWTFSYESDYVVTVSFEFYLTDSHGESSPNYLVNLNITEDPSRLPPLARNASFSVNQGDSYDFDFMSLVTNRDNSKIIWVQIVSNPNSSVIGPDPSMGNLRSANGIPFGSATSSPFLSPVSGVPTPFLAQFTSINSGVTSFSYKVCDATILTSNTAVITFTINHVNFPPVISVIPTSTLYEPRAQTGMFTIVVTDSDSYNVTLYIHTDPTNALPLDYCNVTFVPTSGPLSNYDSYTPLTSERPPYSANISYTPFTTMPDSTTGTFYLQACDEQGACSSEEIRSVSVTPNNPPKVVDVTGRDYNIINKEDQSRVIILTGSDLDSYHTTKLTFVIQSTTKDGSLSLCTPDGNVTQPILPGDVPLTVQGIPDDEHQRTYLVVCYTPLDFYLSVDPVTGLDIPDVFRFYVVDLLGSASATQKVSINTNESIPHPPSSSDTSLYVHEHDCLVDSCGTPILNPPFVQIPCTALDATASSNYSLIFSAPENMKGEVFTTDSNGTFVSVPIGEPIPRPWRFYYQPPSQQVLNDTYPFVVLPYVIYVDQSNSSVYYLSIYVIPVNDPPVGDNVEFNSSMNLPGNVTLAHSDPDDPDSALVLYIVSIPITNKATFTSLDGTPIALNRHISSWTLTATPFQDVYSNPSTQPVATIQYQIVDHYDEGPDKRSSDIYTVSYIVNYVYYPIHYAADPSTTMAEDTTCLITLDNNGPSGWFGGNKEYQHVTIILYNFHDDNQPGNYALCDSFSNCRSVNESDLPIEVPHGSQIQFTPGANLNGQNFSHFDFNVIPVTPVPTLNVTWTINVTPVNDPPVTIPYYVAINAPNGGEANRCDENTTFIAGFYATDIDSPISSLYAEWLTILDDMPYTFYDCSNVTNGHPSIRNSTCSQGVTMDLSLPSIPLHGYAHWLVVMVPDMNYFTSFKSIDFSVRSLDNYNAPSIPVKATINVDPINSAPYFVPFPDGNLFDQSVQGSYVLLRGYVKDPDFQRGYPIRLTVTTQDGTLGLPFSASKCVLSNNNRTLTCQDLIEKINTFFYQKNPAGIPFYPPSLDVSLSATINFFVNDLGNIDKNHPPHNLSCNATAIVTQEVAITAAAAKGGNSAVTSIAAGVGVACAVGIGVAAAVLFKSSKAATDLYLAEFVSNLDSAGNMYNPLYTEATKKAVNPFYAGAGGSAAT